MRWAIVAATLVSTVYCVTMPEVAHANSYERSVSIIHLITRPQEVEGLRLRTAGFLARTLNLYLYLSEEYSKLEDINSAIGVDSEALDDLAANGCLDRYVWIIGEFGRLDSGEFAMRRLDEVWIPSAPSGKKLCWKRKEGVVDTQ